MGRTLTPQYFSHCRNNGDTENLSLSTLANCLIPVQVWQAYSRTGGQTMCRVEVRSLKRHVTLTRQMTNLLGLTCHSSECDSSLFYVRPVRGVVYAKFWWLMITLHTQPTHPFTSIYTHPPSPHFDHTQASTLTPTHPTSTIHKHPHSPPLRLFTSMHTNLHSPHFD